MQTLKMRVYRKYHPNGTPWKDWAICEVNGVVTVRFGSAGKTVQERNPSGTRYENERKKEREGYRYEGEFFVTNTIDFNSTATAPASTVSQQDAAALQPEKRQSKFGGGLVYWKIAKDLPADWMDVIRTAIAPLVDQGLIRVESVTESALQLKGAIKTLEIDAKGSRRGVVQKSEDAHLFVLSLLTIARVLPQFVLADDGGNQVTAKLRQTDTYLGADWEVIEPLAGTLGLVLSKKDLKEEEAEMLEAFF